MASTAMRWRSSYTRHNFYKPIPMCLHMRQNAAHSFLLTITYAKRNTENTPRYTTKQLKHYFPYTYHGCDITARGSGCNSAALFHNVYGYVQKYCIHG